MELLAIQPAQYPYKRVQIITDNLEKGILKKTFSQISSGVAPTRCFVYFKKASYFTDTTANTWKMEHLNVTEINLKINNTVAQYSEKLSLDYEKNEFNEAYSMLFKNIREAPNDIDTKDYKNGSCAYVFNTTADSCSDDHTSLPRDGSLKLDVVFGKPIPLDMIAFFYLEYDALMQINKSGNILLS